MSDDDVILLHVVDEKIRQFETTTVDVEYSGPPGYKLWIQGLAGPVWPMSDKTLISMEENPIPMCSSFEITGQVPGEYKIVAWVTSPKGEVVYKSPRVSVEVLGIGAKKTAGGAEAYAEDAQGFRGELR